MYSSLKSWKYILVSTFKYKKPAFLAFFKSISAGNRPILLRFHTFRVAWKAYLTSITPFTTTPRPGTPPANSRPTKQRWSSQLSVCRKPRGFCPMLFIVPSSIVFISLLCISCTWVFYFNSWRRGKASFFTIFFHFECVQFLRNTLFRQETKLNAA